MFRYIKVRQKAAELRKMTMDKGWTVAETGNLYNLQDLIIWNDKLR